MEPSLYRTHPETVYQPDSHREMGLEPINQARRLGQYYQQIFITVGNIIQMRRRITANNSVFEVANCQQELPGIMESAGGLAMNLQ